MGRGLDLPPPPPDLVMWHVQLMSKLRPCSLWLEAGGAGQTAAQMTCRILHMLQHYMRAPSIVLDYLIAWVLAVGQVGQCVGEGLDNKSYATCCFGVPLYTLIEQMIGHGHPKMAAVGFPFVVALPWWLALHRQIHRRTVASAPCGTILSDLTTRWVSRRKHFWNTTRLQPNKGFLHGP